MDVPVKILYWKKMFKCQLNHSNHTGLKTLLGGKVVFSEWFVVLFVCFFTILAFLLI